MNSISHTGAATMSYDKRNFLTRFRKALKMEIKNTLLLLMTFIAYVSSIIFGVYLFLAEFGLMKSILGALTSVFVVYCAGMYLTLLPASLVYLLVIFVVIGSWTKFVYPILGAAVFFSFFIIFLV